MGDHLLHLLEVEGGLAWWSLSCEHADDDQRWWPVNEDGTAETTIDGERCTYCWLWSWWDGVGAELIGHIDFDGKPVSFPLPVRPDGNWTFNNGGTLVRDEDHPHRDAVEDARQERDYWQREASR